LAELLVILLQRFGIITQKETAVSGSASGKAMAVYSPGGMVSIRDHCTFSIVETVDLVKRDCSAASAPPASQQLPPVRRGTG
jgi:hypothetical protein